MIRLKQQYQKYVFTLLLAFSFNVFSHGNDHQFDEFYSDDLAIPEKGYIVEEVSDGLYWFTSGFQQTFFLVDEQGVIAVDAPPSIIDNYLKAIKYTTSKPIKYLVYSHAHTDHIGAASAFPASAKRISHKLVYDSLKRANDPNRPLPDITFEESYQLKLGTQTLKLSYHGPNHQSGNIIMYAPKQKVLSLMDFLFTGSSPFPYFGHAEDVPGMLRHHDILLNFDFDMFISGHIGRAATRNDIVIQKQYMETLIKHTDAVLKESSVFQTYQRLGPDTAIMTAMTAWLDEVAEEVAKRTLEEWKGRLPGIESTTKFNAVPIIQSRRVD